MSAAPDKTSIGFIGCGVMGSSMVSNLLKAGYEVVVYTRTPEKADAVVAQGAQRADTLIDAAEDVDVVITMVGYPRDVEEVYMETDGLLEIAKDDAYLIDMTTSAPKLAKDIFQSAEVRGLHALDAPVSGGDIGAKNGTLTIMVGGKEEDFNFVLPIFEAMGKKIVRQGDAGAGQSTKMANQIALSGALVGAVEALSYARQMGLDPKSVLDSVAAGSGTSWQLENMGPRILEEDFAPGFYTKHLFKDLRIALESSEEAGLLLPGAETAYEMYEMLVRVGGQDLGTQALFLLYGDEEQWEKHGLDISKIETEETHEHEHDPQVFTSAVEVEGIEGNIDLGPSGLPSFLDGSFFSDN